MSFVGNIKEEEEEAKKDEGNKKTQYFLPNISIRAQGENTRKSQEGNQKVHYFEDIVTFRKKTEKKENTEEKEEKSSEETKQIRKEGQDDEKLMKEAKAKSQLLEASDSLKRKDVVAPIEMTQDSLRGELSNNDISAFSNRKVNYLKNLITRKKQIKIQGSKSKASAQENQTGDIQQKAEVLRQRTNLILDRLMASNLKPKKAEPKPESEKNPLVNVRNETTELCQRALLKTKSIYMNLHESQKSRKSSSTSALNNNFEFCRRKKSKKSANLECLHQIQYSKLMKEIEDIQGVNTLLIAGLNNSQQKIEEEYEGKDQKISKNINKNSYVPNSLQKRIKFVNRKTKTTVENHSSQQTNELRIIDGIGLKRQSTVELNYDNEQHHKGELIFKAKAKKNRSHSMMIQVKQNDIPKRYKMSEIQVKMREDKEKQQKVVENDLQPISRSLSYNFKEKSPQKDSFAHHKPSQHEPNIKVSLEVSNQNKNHIINSIKLFSQTRKSKNISDLLSLERSRFKMTYLMKELQGKI